MMRVTTKNSVYEFSFTSHKADGSRRGIVSKNGEAWTECHMLSLIEAGSRMVMMLGETRDSGVRTTTVVTEIEY